MPQVKGFIIYLVISTNGHIYVSRQHSSLKSLSANLSVYIRYGFLATTMPLIIGHDYNMERTGKRTGQRTDQILLNSFPPPILRCFTARNAENASLHHSRKFEP